MSIPGQQNINIGLPNESIGSDSLFVAFTKTQQNFTTLFNNASAYTNFVGANGIGVTANSATGTVTVTNQGVTNIIAGTGVVINSSNGNVTISATGGNGNGSGGTVTSVGVFPVSNTRLTSSRTSPVVSEGDFLIDLATTGVLAGNYSNPTLTVDAYGRVTAASNNIVAGTVTSVGLTPGPGIQVGGGPVTSNGNITVTNTGVLRINAGTGISLSSGNGNVTISTTMLGGTVTSVNVTSNNLLVSGGPIVNSGTISVNLPNSVSFLGNVDASNVNANFVKANSGNINGDLVVIGNISPAANNKVGGIKPGPGVVISAQGELTIDGANLPISFGNFYADNNVLSIVNNDEDMVLQTEGNAEIQLVGNIGFYKPDGLPPNVANRYFSATSDGQIKILVPDSDPVAGAVEIIGTSSGLSANVVNTGVMLHITGQNGIPSRIYNDSVANFAAFVGRRINGTVASPTPVQAGDELIRISSTGYNGTEISGGGSARIVFQAMENFTTSNTGSNLSFWTSAIGSNTLSKIATIDNANGVVATKLASTSTLTATGNANVGNIGTGAVVASANITTGGNVVANGTYGYNVATNNATITQLTSKSTAVTCNGRTGQIATSNSSLAKGAAVTFTVNNTFVTAVTDIPVIAIQTGATANSYAISVTRVQVGSFNITITNNGAGPLADILTINFALLKVS